MKIVADMKVVEQFSVKRPPKEVFDFIAVSYFENHHKFDPEIEGMINQSGGSVREGTLGKEIRKVIGKKIVTDFKVTKFIAPETFELINTSGPFYLLRNYTIKPSRDGTDVSFLFDIAPKTFLGRLVLPVMKGSFERNVKNNISNLALLLNN